MSAMLTATSLRYATICNQAFLSAFVHKLKYTEKHPQCRNCWEESVKQGIWSWVIQSTSFAAVHRHWLATLASEMSSIRRLKFHLEQRQFLDVCSSTFTWELLCISIWHLQRSVAGGTFTDNAIHVFWTCTWFQSNFYCERVTISNNSYLYIL